MHKLAQNGQGIQPLVEIFMPCYNYGKYIREAIDSLQSQSYANFRVIIADDASSDGTTPGVLMKLSETLDDNRFSFYFEKKNLGINKITNKYVTNFTGKYILIFSPDDILDGEYLRKTVDFLEANTEYAAVTTWVQCFGESTDLIKYTLRGASLPDMLIVNGMCGTSLMRQSVIEKVGVYSDQKDVEYEDYDLWLRMLENNYKLGVVEEPLFNYRISASSRIHSMSSKTLLDFQLATIRRHRRLYEENSLFVIQSLLADKYKILNDFNHVEKLHTDLLTAYKSLQKGFEDQSLEISNLQTELQKIRQKLLSIPGYKLAKTFMKRTDKKQ